MGLLRRCGLNVSEKAEEMVRRNVRRIMGGSGHVLRGKMGLILGRGIEAGVLLVHIDLQRLFGI